MRLTQILLGGLAWAPIRPNNRTKANARKRAARVAKVESFLKQYPLNKYKSKLPVTQLRYSIFNSETTK